MQQKPFKKIKARSANHILEQNCEENSYFDFQKEKNLRSHSFDFRNEHEESIEDEHLYFEPDEEIKDNSFDYERKVKYLNAKNFGGENYTEKEGTLKLNSFAISYETPIKFSENIKKIKKDLDEETSQFIFNCLKTHFIFANMSEIQL